jgi:hypothetical protein
VTNQTVVPEPILLARRITGPLVEHLRLPVNALGRHFLEFSADPGFSSSIGSWWEAQPRGQQIPREWLAALAAPALAADIRTLYQNLSQTTTWALAGGMTADSPWLLLAPVRDLQDYHVQAVPGREYLVNTMLNYLETQRPIWVPEMQFTIPLTEFTVLLAMTDLHTRRHHASMIVHEGVPDFFAMDELLQGWKNVTELPDPRYLVPFVAHMLDDRSRQLPLEAVAALADELAKRGFLRRQEKGWQWTDPGLFLAESLRRRTCAVAIDIVGAAPGGGMGEQGALWVRADKPLFFFNIDRIAGTVTCVGAGDELARRIMTEIFTPQALPPATAAIPVPGPGTAPAPPPPQPPQPQAQGAPPPPPAAAVFCGNCGGRRAANAQFCPHCGSRL